MSAADAAVDRQQRLAIFEANLGRDSDWWVELDDRRVGRLTDPCWVDMFWWEYRIDLEGYGDDARVLIEDHDLWFSGKLAFRSVPFGIVAKHAFCGGKGPRDRRVTMRALCIDIGEPTCLESVLLWWRRRRIANGPLLPVP